MPGEIRPFLWKTLLALSKKKLFLGIVSVVFPGVSLILSGTEQSMAIWSNPRF